MTNRAMMRAYLHLYVDLFIETAAPHQFDSIETNHEALSMMQEHIEIFCVEQTAKMSLSDAIDDMQ